LFASDQEATHNNRNFTRRQEMKKTVLLAAAVLFSSASFADGYNYHDKMATYEITITNATKHHVFTPPIIIAHRHNFKLFSVGGEATDGLTALAEGGDTSILYGEVVNARGVAKVMTTNTFIPYGQTATFTIEAPRFGMYFSVAGMLATTNDGFFAVNGVKAGKHHNHTMALVYDAGSEMNNEMCTHIPGPPCAPDSGNARTDTGEGFISVHNGIHGVGDLSEADLDWHNPGAMVTIKRVK
jgi:hypothetical protein